MNLLGVHLIDVDVRCIILIHIGSLQRLDVHLVFKGAQLELIKLLPIVSVSSLLIWKLFCVHLV